MEASLVRFEYVTRLGDTALILSQRLAELCGKGPALEEDIALTNTALDLLGQARLWLSYAAELEAAGRDEDALAYLREDRAFRNFLLVELPHRDYGEVLMRQFYFDVWHDLALARLTGSRNGRIAAIAAKAHKECAYHLRRSSDLVIRLGDGSEKSHQRMQEAADELWPYTGEFFEADEADETMMACGEGFAPPALREPWLRTVQQVFSQATLRMPPADVWMHRGGKHGLHTEHLSYLLAEMQVLQRQFPGAKW